MNRAQRIVLIVYCLLIVYCCVWIPWHFAPPGEMQVNAGYGWLWAASEGATPALPLFGIRLLAATALAIAAFFLVGMWK